MATAQIFNPPPQPPPEPTYVVTITTAEARAILRALRQVRKDALDVDPNAQLDPDQESVRKELSKTLP